MREKHWPAEPPEGSRTSFRRTALADWITDTQYGGRSARGAGDRQSAVAASLWDTASSPRRTISARGAKRPSHPELLDWLAGELIRHGWRLKPIQRLILTSAVYLRESAKSDRAKAAVDPGNRLFWRHEKRRLEGEVVRDALLACGNRLDERMYGPGSLDEAQRRRSIYFTVKRSELVPMMQVFDAPEALTSMGDRPSTTIAPQALLLLNNPNVRADARAFAARLLPAFDRSTAEAVRERLPNRPVPRAAAEPSWRIQRPSSNNSAHCTSRTHGSHQIRRPRVGPARLLPGADVPERIRLRGLM